MPDDNTDRVLSAIDDAIAGAEWTPTGFDTDEEEEDESWSNDAMRWRPPEQDAPAQQTEPLQGTGRFGFDGAAPSRIMWAPDFERTGSLADGIDLTPYLSATEVRVDGAYASFSIPPGRASSFLGHRYTPAFSVAQPDPGPDLPTNPCTDACQHRYFHGDVVYDEAEYYNRINRVRSGIPMRSPDHTPWSWGPHIEEWERAVQPGDRISYRFGDITGETTVREVRGNTIHCVPEVADPAAPTSAELAAGIPLAHLGPDGITTEQPPLPEPEPAPSGEEFRARALDHVRNRNTGPARPDNRRWRNT